MQLAKFRGMLGNFEEQQGNQNDQSKVTDRKWGGYTL